MTDAENDLIQARKAWKTKRSAELEMARLQRYAKLTPGMRDDLSRAMRSHTAALATLNRILGASADPNPTAPATAPPP